MRHGLLEHSSHDSKHMFYEPACMHDGAAAATACMPRWTGMHKPACMLLQQLLLLRACVRACVAARVAV
jgi:hypothetical protein